MMSNPTISVIIPLYNGASYVGAAIESVLAQTLTAEEIIVVDDGSVDDGFYIASRYPGITGLQQANGGIAAARNCGLGVARGDWIALLDADDLWPTDRLELLLTEQLARPQPGIVFGATEEFISPDVTPELARTLKAASGPQQWQSLNSCLIPRALFELVGLFDVQWRAGEQIDWLLRAAAAGVGRSHIPQTVLRRRLHASNHGVRNREVYRDYARIVHAARRRGLTGSTS
ncbi:glycosyltransferase family 2 protein [Azospirillum endophyticum]